MHLHKKINSNLMNQYCGLDVHKDSVFACIINESGVLKEQKFGTLTSDLYEFCFFIGAV